MNMPPQLTEMFCGQSNLPVKTHQIHLYNFGKYVSLKTFWTYVLPKNRFWDKTLTTLQLCTINQHCIYWSSHNHVQHLFGNTHEWLLKSSL